MNELTILSLVISLIYSELTQLAPGGIIIPLYFVLYMDDPVKIGATLLTSVLSLCLIRILSHFTILYGRRKFTMYIVTGVLLKILFSYLYFGNSYLFYNLSLTIGYLVPGILGREMERQGAVKTLVSLGLVVALIRLIQICTMQQ